MSALTSPTSPSSLDVIVIGGGQAGLAMAWHLMRQGLRFVVLDANENVGHSWRSRWESLKLFTPAQFDGLPGKPFPAPADTYPGKDQVADYLRDYASSFELPLISNALVSDATLRNGMFEVRSEAGTFEARQLVVATGPFQVASRPSIADRLDSSVAQLHSSQYRNPNQLPHGAVLVVGGGNSGFQIAKELSATHTVELSIGTKAPTLPQRVLGRDIFWWLIRSGLMDKTADSWIARRVRRGPDSVMEITPRRLRQLGVAIRPRAVEASGNVVRFEDGSTTVVTAVIWATGFRSSYSWMNVPGVIVGDEIRHRRGVTSVRGLYFLGLPWQHTRGSSLLGFVKRDAAFLSGEIAALHRQLDDQANPTRWPASMEVMTT